MKNSLLIIALLIFIGCKGQQSNDSLKCNRKTVDESIDKLLPKGVCVPEEYTVDQVTSEIDYNGDGRRDVVIRYSEYPLKEGTPRFYSIYQGYSDTSFVRKMDLPNVYPPYIRNIYAAASDSGSVGYSLLQQFPYDTKLEFINDTIKLSHRISFDYGKTYLFIYDSQKENWFLNKTIYWVGEIDRRDLEQMDLSMKLLEKILLETKAYDGTMPIDKFDLKDSKRKSEEEKEYLLENYDVMKWQRE